MNDFNEIITLYSQILQQSKLDNDYALIFIYNSEKTISDAIHQTECVLKNEKEMIVSSFRNVFEYVYPIDGEQLFIDKILNLKKKHHFIFVYSMAQNINGIGRRCLIPLLCDFYNLININANFMSSTYSDNKYLMHQILLSKNLNHFPRTIYYKHENDLKQILLNLKSGKWVFKPNDESASIGVYIKDFTNKDMSEIIKFVNDYKSHFPIFCIQEFIDGQEVAVPLLWYSGKYYCPGISEVVFLGEKNYLDYQNVMLENYNFKEYSGPLMNELIEFSIKVATLLDFKGISRIDYRIKDNYIYVEDIGSNPTISESNGVNILFSNRLNSTSSCVYELLSYIALIENNLFIPSLNNSK